MNEAHGITPNEPAAFNSFGELPDVIERVLIAHGVKLHATGRDGKLWNKDTPEQAAKMAAIVKGMPE
jgi:hypothetical protein